MGDILVTLAQCTGKDNTYITQVWPKVICRCTAPAATSSSIQLAMAKSPQHGSRISLF